MAHTNLQVTIDVAGVNQQVEIKNEISNLNQAPAPDLIDEFVALMQNLTDAPDIIIKGAAYWNVSSTLGPMVRIYGLPRKKRLLAPNVYVIIIGKAGLSRKSTIIGYCRLIYKETTQDSDGEGIILDGTFEGIIDWIELHKDRDDFHGISEELGPILVSMRKKDYQSGVMGLYSGLYYGESYKQVLAGKGKESNIRKIREGIYYSILAGMQDPVMNNYMDQVMIVQGLIRRMILLNTQKEDYTRSKPLIDPLREKAYNNSFDALVQRFKNRRDELNGAIANLPEGIQHITAILLPDVEDAINKLDNAIREEALRDYESSTTDAISTQGETLLKLCVLAALADTDNQLRISHDSALLNVFMKHYIKAKSFFDEYLKRYKELVEEISSPSLIHKSNTQKKIWNRILKHIAHPITTGDLLRVTGMKKKELVDGLRELAEQGLVHTARTKPQSTAGRPSIWICSDPSVLRNFLDANEVNSEKTYYSPSQVETVIDTWGKQ